MIELNDFTAYQLTRSFENEGQRLRLQHTTAIVVDGGQGAGVSVLLRSNKMWAVSGYSPGTQALVLRSGPAFEVTGGAPDRPSVGQQASFEVTGNAQNHLANTSHCIFEIEVIT